MYCPLLNNYVSKDCFYKCTPLTTCSRRLRFTVYDRLMFILWKYKFKIYSKKTHFRQNRQRHAFSIVPYFLAMPFSSVPLFLNEQQTTGDILSVSNLGLRVSPKGSIACMGGKSSLLFIEAVHQKQWKMPYHGRPLAHTRNSIFECK